MGSQVAAFDANTPLHLLSQEQVQVTLYLRHFELHCQGDETLAAEEAQCHWCQIRLFSTHQQYPISIQNLYDNEQLPKNFRFIENSIYSTGVESAGEDFRIGCECTSGSACKRDGCHCLSDMAIENESHANKKIYAYHSYGQQKERLRSSFLDSRQPIYECHSKCKCRTECPNRVVERGRKVELQVFRTRDGRGWGVRSRVDISTGQFVGKYVGEVITAEEANRRREKSAISKRKDVYLFALDKFIDPESTDERLRGPPLEVDGEFVSGPTRFINHSCDPNLRIFARVGVHADKHLHDLAFFAIKDIPAGAEWTFDYVDGNEESYDDSKDPKKRKDMTRCLCGSDNCRGYLW